ncbi:MULTISPECIES: hypothetical protein [unclassified Mesorhizobium]|uniref:hypothetical protein n=1 Tax=unclassified Mesorhizobium TaxID=325217 RepID=UPI003336CB05
MRSLLGGIALAAIFAASAGAETRYDRKLEEAVMGIVAGKIGEIRGGFSYKQAPQFVVMPDTSPKASISVDRPRPQVFGDSSDGLTPAVERRVSRTIF